MRATKIDVIPDDIRNGHARSTTRSPLCLAVLRYVPRGVEVIDSGEDIAFRLPATTYRPNGRFLSSDLPEEARDFSRHYEASHYGPCSRVEPFSFALRVPDQTDLKEAA